MSDLNDDVVGLASLQSSLQRAMTDLRGEATDTPELLHIAHAVRPSSRMQPLERLAVYRDAYFARLLACLTDDYPALRSLLGAERFEELCKRYVAMHPPTAPSLNDYGRRLAAFCAREPVPDAALLRDLARVEWARVELIHVPEQSPLPAAELVARQASFGQARLVPVAALRLLELEHPVHALHEALRAGRSTPLPAPARTFELLRRVAWQIRCEPLPLAEGELLASVLAGMPIGEALVAAAERGVSEYDVSACFERWLAAGLFASFA